MDNIIHVIEHNSNRLRLYVPMCFENALISYSKTMNENYKAAFIDYWNFLFFREADNAICDSGDKQEQYSEGNEELSDDLAYEQGHKKGKLSRYIGVYENCFEGMEKYCGVKIERISDFKFEELLAFIKENLKRNKTTLLHTDTYYLPWNKTFFGKDHTTHISQICGYDEEKDSFAIADQDFPNQVFYLNSEQLESACKYYFRFEKIENYKKKSAIELLSEFIQNSNSKFEDLKNNIIEFAEKFRTEFSPEEEFDSPFGADEVLDSQLIITLREIIKGRNLFMDFLDDVSAKSETDFSDVIQGLFVSASKWNHIINVLVKYAIVGWEPDINHKISNVIRESAEIEYSTYKLLKEKVLNSGKEEKMAKAELLQSNKYYFVPLKQYCNNKGILCHIKEGQKENNLSGLTNTGEVLVLSERYKNKKVSLPEVEYLLTVDDGYDNLLCEGQSIQIESEDFYHSMGILCCTEFGTNHEHIKIIDEENHEEIVYFDAYDISDCTAENTVDIGACYSAVSDKIVREKNVLTTNVLKFNCAKKIQKIVLPYCFNLHIMAITFFR